MGELRVINENLEEKNGTNYLDEYTRYLKKCESEQREQDIIEVVNMLKENPDLTEEMVRPDLKKVFRIAKREYIKQIIKENRNNNTLNLR